MVDDTRLDVGDGFDSDFIRDVIVVPGCSTLLEVFEGEVKREDAVPKVAQVGVHGMIAMGDTDREESAVVGDLSDHDVRRGERKSIGVVKKLQQTMWSGEGNLDNNLLVIANCVDNLMFLCFDA